MIEELYKKFIRHPVICTDTRQLTKGCIFFALKGENFNGNKFAASALENGAAYAVVDEKEFAADERFIVCDNLLETLQHLARHHRRQFKIPVLAITGSNGKTTTKELIAAVLSEKFNTLYTKGNLNNHIGVPLTLLQITAQHEMAVIEMGANHQGEIRELCKIALPDAGMITNIGKAHLEGFGGIEGVKKGKGEMYDFLKSSGALIFINGDDTVLQQMCAAYQNTVTYGSSPHNVVCGNASMIDNYVSVEISKPFSLSIKSNLTGIYNFNNILAAVAIGNYYNVPPDSIRSAIEKYIPSNQRSQVIRKNNNVVVILDAYNANPSSMSAALTAFEKSFPGKKVIALGGMKELGDDEKKEHENIGELLNKINADVVLLTGEEFKDVAKNYSYNYFNNSTEAAEWLKQINLVDCSILIKGSRAHKMEVLADVIP